MPHRTPLCWLCIALLLTLAVAARAVPAECAGARHGDPLVLLMHGIGAEADSTTWSQVMPRLAERAHVCRYDRAGSGGRPAAGIAGPDKIVAEARAVIDAAGAEQVIAVGHSFGGYPARLLADALGADAVGLVLVEAPDPALGLRRATGVETWDSVPTGGERLALAAIERAVAQLPPPDHPVTVISRGKGVSPAWSAAQQRLARLGPAPRHVTAGRSGHMVPLDQPELVADEICRLLPPG